MVSKAEPVTSNPQPTFPKIADLFLAHSTRENKPTTVRMHTMSLQSFCDAVGKKGVSELKVHRVTEFGRLDRMGAKHTLGRYPLPIANRPVHPQNALMSP